MLAPALPRGVVDCAFLRAAVSVLPEDYRPGASESSESHCDTIDIVTDSLDLER